VVVRRSAEFGSIDLPNRWDTYGERRIWVAGTPL